MFACGPRVLAQDSTGQITSAQGQLSCSDTGYTEYMKIMLEAGEMTISRQPASGTRAQQQKMIDAFAALELPVGKTIVAVRHTETGKVYTNICKNEKCTFDEMAKPEQVCLTEHWNDCPYFAMQFRDRQYCFLDSASQ